jgi:hypothetical protein
MRSLLLALAVGLVLAAGLASAEATPEVPGVEAGETYGAPGGDEPSSKGQTIVLVLLAAAGGVILVRRFRA